jgi:hypothetical protein
MNADAAMAHNQECRAVFICFLHSKGAIDQAHFAWSSLLRLFESMRRCRIGAESHKQKMRWRRKIATCTLLVPEVA